MRYYDEKAEESRARGLSSSSAKRAKVLSVDRISLKDYLASQTATLTLFAVLAALVVAAVIGTAIGRKGGSADSDDGQPLVFPEDQICH
jgi:hypothetical protein